MWTTDFIGVVMFDEYILPGYEWLSAPGIQFLDHAVLPSLIAQMDVEQFDLSIHCMFHENLTDDS